MAPTILLKFPFVFSIRFVCGHESISCLFANLVTKSNTIAKVFFFTWVLLFSLGRTTPLLNSIDQIPYSHNYEPFQQTKVPNLKYFYAIKRNCRTYCFFLVIYESVQLRSILLLRNVFKHVQEHIMWAHTRCKDVLQTPYLTWKMGFNNQVYFSMLYIIGN
jgi:hypothetical protein